jgi:hypothetical protein
MRDHTPPGALMPGRRPPCSGAGQAFRRKNLKTIAIVSLALLLSACIVTKDSPAPGCVQTLGCTGAGGCLGKTAILDLMVQPAIECLTITVNNCNGGVLEVRHTCPETLLLGGIEITSSDYASLDVVKEPDGAYSLVDVSSNFSDYVPQEDQRIVLTGLLGKQEIQVAFTKTAQLCE